MSATALDAFQMKCGLYMTFLNYPWINSNFWNWSIELGILTFNLIWGELDLEAKQSIMLINQHPSSSQTSE